MNKRIFAFRVDASLEIGTGHVMRCLTLADALRGAGGCCYFVCRRHPGNLFDLIQTRGHTVFELPQDSGYSTCADTSVPLHAHWLGADWITDAWQTNTALGESVVDWLIVDHYALDIRWEQAMRKSCHRLMVIDDLADRNHDCDLLLDQNLGRVASDYSKLVPAATAILAGPNYALLRPQFAALRAISLERRSEPMLKRIMLSMGGVDKDNVTGLVLEVLNQCNLPKNCQIIVVMGPHAPWLLDVREKAQKMQWATEVLVGVDDMAKLMTESDLAIGAAGSTSWERCALGLPTLLVILAENQREAAYELSNADAVIKLDLDSNFCSELKSALIDISVDFSSLKKMSYMASLVCDGSGGQVVSRLLFS